MYKIGFITLGCKVNIYESNALADEFKKLGYEVVSNDSVADAYIINTCSVTNQADAKSRKMIRHARSLNKDAVVCAMGCFTQSHHEQALEMDEPDILIGNGNKRMAIELIDSMLKNNNRHREDHILKERSQKDYEMLEATEFETTRAFLKIEDGCSNFCSYCIIPYARGPVRSKDKEKVLEELKNIVDLGYEEVVLSGIHIGAYSSGPEYHLKDLIKDMIEVNRLSRVRISSIEINEVNDTICSLMASSNKIADHIHIPLQAGSDKILKLMNRHYDTAKFLDRVNKLREVRPNISLTTDVIVGFPGETDQDFEDCYNFIKKVGFSELHVFPYSPREGTPAASMKNQVDGNVKKERVKRLIELSKELWHDYCMKFIGSTQEVIVETKYKDDYIVGHASNYLHVLLPYDPTLLRHKVLVRIDSMEGEYMHATLIKDLDKGLKF
ncbi:MAG: tRNA (N(6)-L-threonylcarbamoyladenosine(37)-C(2))-methylthiotransferase MtaB [Acholeplasmatales bacterium]|nr:tRNA (N(6)-L-threonylcarbamoyladenosine(37)-C(2))-methylthiotransferase MtaB [Acholeplasmatales bacterium]